MQEGLQRTQKPALRQFRSGDPRSMLAQLSPAEILKQHGFPKSLLSSSLKADKCRSVGVLTRILFFTPGVFCPHATAGCLAACLGHCCGKMRMPTHALARDRRTALFLESPDLFAKMLDVELSLLQEEARRLGLIPSVRLNGSSDLPWERLRPELFSMFPELQFFDYTKNAERMNRFLQKANWPENYYLSFSAHSRNRAQAETILKRGGTAAVVFSPDIPDSLWGFPVINGDEHDVRFRDPKGTIVGLTAKGLARTDATGFTIRTSTTGQSTQPGESHAPSIDKNTATPCRCKHAFPLPIAA